MPHADHAFSATGLASVDSAKRIYKWSVNSRIFYSSQTEIRQHINSEAINKLNFIVGLDRLIQIHHLGLINDHKGKPIYVAHPSINGWFTPPPMPQLELNQVTEPFIPGTAL